MPKIIFIIIYFVYFLLSALQPALAKEESPGALHKTWPLGHFMTNDEPIQLKNTNDSYTINFPIADRVEPESVELKLVISNSNLLKTNRAQLVVLINGFVAGQIKLDPINSETQAKFTLAREYLKNDYNQLTFRVAQHYTDSQCEDSSAPELWTRVNSIKSTLTINADKKTVDTRLSQLGSLINDRLGSYSLSILRSEDTVSDDYLYWGAIVTQGVKLRLKYVPLSLNEQRIKPYQWPQSNSTQNAQFAIDPEQLKHDAVLIGTKQQIGSFLPDSILQSIQGAYLGIFRQDKAPQRFILIISGIDNQEVTKAVQAFALLNLGLPDTAWTIIKDIDFGAMASTSRQTVVPGSTYQFSRFGFTDSVFDRTNSSTNLAFYIPADMYSTEEAQVSINLDLAYGAALRRDSVINIKLNGLFNQAIPLKEASGAHYSNYQINIPLRSFQPGLNNLSFEAVLTPSEYGECSFIQTGNLIASIYQNSTLTFPKTGSAATLPDLKLFERTGFPLVKGASADQSAFRLLDTSSDTIASAWHFIAHLTTFTHAPIFDLHITQDKNLSQPNQLLIGKLSEKTHEIFTEAPIELGKLNQFPYVNQELQRQIEESFGEWLYRTFLSENSKPVAAEIIPNNALITQTSGLGEKYLLMSYPAPANDEGVVFALLSNKEQSLYTGLSELLTPKLWNQLQGNIVVWDKQQNFNSLQQGDTFTSGEKNTKLTYIMHFSRHPWQWLAIIVPLLMLSAWLIHKLLNRYQKNAHPQASGHVD
ncbi:MAG: hypothetical protein CVV13_10740 [Gammaproteobacteria bacterium HGW-Gammaproteobacteria-3]|nr:MAG: hypothetical protein CVV13_10740 [Gammaproteobacteria bacterium HGW-Gammaproteobacteria-3]